MQTWRLVRRDGTLTAYGSGGVELLRSMAATRPAARALAVIPVSLLNRLYGVVARNRQRLGRIVPDGEAPRRFP